MSGARQLGATLLAHKPSIAMEPPRSRRLEISVVALLIVTYVAGCIELGVTPMAVITGAGRLGDISVLMMPPSPGSWSHFWIYLNALGQTLSIAFLGTLLASVFAFPLGFLAARNVVAGRAPHIVARRGLDAVRSVDTLVWALIWVNVVGLGPFAGALAIACTDVAALAKLMSEAVETIDDRAGEAVIAAGGGQLAKIRFGMIPAIVPVFASQMLYFFESNTRSATIIGIVGAGGIGLHLFEMIRVLEWQEVSFLILMVLITVAAIDAISRRLRAAIMGASIGGVGS